MLETMLSAGTKTLIRVQMIHHQTSLECAEKMRSRSLHNGST